MLTPFVSGEVDQPNAMPQAWIDRLFERLSIRYGEAFSRQYEGLKTADVKADWIAVLGRHGCNRAALVYAMDNLPADRPPNAAQFRALCNGLPVRAPLALPRATVKADPNRVASITEKLRTAMANRSNRAWLDSLLAIPPEKRSIAQRDAIQRADVGMFGMGLTQFDGGSFRPIPAEALPPGMRAGAQGAGAKS